MANSATTEVFNQRAVAQGYLGTVDAVITNAITRAMSGPVANPTPAAYAITALEPSVPEVENSTLTFDAQRDKIVAMLTDELEGFFVKYYPLASDAFDEATNWLVNSITLGGTGIDPSVEAQIWQRDRDRVVSEGLRAEAQTLSEFSGRGFSIPPGAAAARLATIKTGQMENLQASSRDAAIKQADMAVENLRFAVDNAIKSRMSAMQAAADYIRALMSGTDTAARVASINSDAKARMMGATSDLYRARLARDELAMKIPLSNQDAALKVQGLNIEGYSKAASTAGSAAETEARAFASGAQAALAAISTIVSSSENSFA
jgi:hypothetical protein